MEIPPKIYILKIFENIFLWAEMTNWMTTSCAARLRGSYRLPVSFLCPVWGTIRKLQKRKIFLKILKTFNQSNLFNLTRLMITIKNQLHVNTRHHRVPLSPDQSVLWEYQKHTLVHAFIWHPAELALNLRTFSQSQRDGIIQQVKSILLKNCYYYVSEALTAIY